MSLAMCARRQTSVCANNLLINIAALGEIHMSGLNIPLLEEADSILPFTVCCKGKLRLIKSPWIVCFAISVIPSNQNDRLVTLVIRAFSSRIPLTRIHWLLLRMLIVQDNWTLFSVPGAQCICRVLQLSGNLSTWLPIPLCRWYGY